MKKFLLVAICFFGNYSFVNAQYTETINSNRPGDSQGAFSVGTNVLQLETALRLGHEEHALRNTETDLFGLSYALRFGIGFERLEVNWMGSFLSSTENIASGANEDELKIRNFEYNTLGFKYLVYDPYRKRSLEGPNIRSWKANFKFRWRDLIPAVSLYAGANFALGDSPYYIPNEPQMTPKVALITQHNFHSWVLVMNFIMDKFTTDFPTTSGIFTLTHSFNPNFAAFAEYQAIKSDLYSDDIFRAGAAYLINQNFQVHASGLMNFKDTPSKWQVAVGISYRLDMHSYNEFVIPKEDKKKQKEEKELEEKLKEKQQEFDEAKPKK